MIGSDACGEDVFAVAGAVDLKTDGTAERTHSPGLRLPPGHALSCPLGVRGQVVNELPADLVGGLEGVRLLQHTHTEQMMGSIYKESLYHGKWLNSYKAEVVSKCCMSAPFLYSGKLLMF